MAEREVAPSLLVTGDIVRGAKDGREWTVLGNVDHEIHLARTTEAGDQKTAVVPHSLLGDKVVLIATEAEATARAKALLTLRVGAEVVGEAVEADGPYRVPQTFPDPGALYSHLFLFHQVADDDAARYPTGNFDDLRRAHAAMHEAPVAVPHVHDPRFYEEG